VSDADIFRLINGLADRNQFVDEVFKAIASDYFLPVLCCLLLVALWFGTSDSARRKIHEIAIIAALSSIGIANGFVSLINNHYFRVRPFNALPPDQVNLIFYPPTDSSFPSNFAAALFALAIPIFIANRKWGTVLLLIALAGGFSRVFVGIHYPLDVLGGAGIGILVGLFSYGLIWLFRPLVNLLLWVLRKIYVA